MSLDLSLQVIAEFPDRETTIPVMGQALREPAARERALDWLLAASETRAAREIVRAWPELPEPLRRRAGAELGPRLQEAARQLIQADRPVTRRGVAAVLAVISRGPNVDLDPLLLDLTLLVDDPDLPTRELARGAFLDAILADPRRVRGLLPHSPLLRTLSVLLRDWDPHRDLRVIEVLLVAGGGAGEWLEQAVAEEWTVAEAIIEAVASAPDDTGASARIAALRRWLEGPRDPARARAREILRRTEDRALLRAAAHHLGSVPPGKESPAWRRLHWGALTDDDLPRLPSEMLPRIAGYLATSERPPAERAQQIAQLIPHTSGPERRAVLAALRGLPVEGIVDHLTPVLQGEDPEARVAAIELLPPRGTAALTGLLPQLAAPDETVRAAASRRLSGHGLDLWSEGRDRIPEGERRRTLSVLRRVDPTFNGQLRGTLGSPDETRVIRALGIVEELDDTATFEEALIDLVVHSSPRVRASVTGPLGRIGAESGEHYLRLLLEDDDPRVVANAVEALDRLEGDETSVWLRRAATHPHPRVSTNALLALVRRGDASARGTLATRAEGQDPAAGESARWALRVLEGEPT